MGNWVRCICIQETHFPSHKPPSCSHKQFPHCFFANSSKKKAGVLIAMRFSLSFKLLHSEVDPNSRYLILNASINNRVMTIVNIYAPNTNQRQFYKTVMEKLKPFQQSALVICGDFNQLVDPLLDSSNPTHKQSTALSSLLCLDLYDP